MHRHQTCSFWMVTGVFVINRMIVMFSSSVLEFISSVFSNHFLCALVFLPFCLSIVVCQVRLCRLQLPRAHLPCTCWETHHSFYSQSGKHWDQGTDCSSLCIFFPSRKWAIGQKYKLKTGERENQDVKYTLQNKVSLLYKHSVKVIDSQDRLL